MKKSLIVVGLCAAATIFAQGPPPGRGPGRMGPGPGGPGGMGMRLEPGINRVVAGAPYSGVEVRETTQTLANGNVISRKTQSNIYRDGMGRMRTESSIPMRLGPGRGAAASTGQTRTIVSIHDPVAGVNRELNVEAKTAREMPLPGQRGGGNLPPANRPGRGAARTPVADPNVTTESLPMQTINGVQATGNRVTRTLPAGEIGNAQPIQIIRETWQSIDLKVPVMIKTIDPRFGTETYQLTNITRSEPDPALFQTPGDYQVTKGRGPFPGGRGPQGGGGVIR